MLLLHSVNFYRESYWLSLFCVFSWVWKAFVEPRVVYRGWKWPDMALGNRYFRGPESRKVYYTLAKEFAEYWEMLMDIYTVASKRLSCRHFEEYLVAKNG